MTNLLIVESPNKAKTIQAMLPGWEVVATGGHIYDLPDKALGVSLTSFRPEYVPNAKGGQYIARLKGAVSRATKVYVGTDPDREGEAIAAHVARACSIRNPIRVRFGSISKSDLEIAIKGATSIDYDLVHAQDARRSLDRLIGWLVSPIFQKLVGIDGLSAGRVQTPAVRLVVDRERAIKAFKPTAYFDVQLEFNTKGVVWTATWIPGELVPKDPGFCTDRLLADDVAATPSVTVSDQVKEKKARKPKAPFTTSTLQQAASVALKLRPDETMAAAQELFEGGLISYHRTDNPNPDAEAEKYIRAWLAANKLPASAKPHRWDAKKGAQEGHPAITPKHVELRSASDPAVCTAATGVACQLSLNAVRLYDLVWIRAVASQMPAAIFDVTTVSLDGTSPKGRAVVFAARGAVLVERGWMALYTVDDEDDGSKDDEQSQGLPDLKTGAVLSVESGTRLDKQTRPPPRFTEASLIKALEDYGIGRPSTYAATMSTITKRGYVLVSKNRQLSAAPKGMLIIGVLEGHFQFVNYEFTATLETYLDRIARGEAEYLPLMQNMYGLLQQEISGAKPPPPHLVPTELRGSLSTQNLEVHPCPGCAKGALVRRTAKTKGKGTKAGHFWSCNQYDREKPDASCRYTAPDEAGRPGRPRVAATS